jgi:hypothetical protein
MKNIYLFDALGKCYLRSTVGDTNDDTSMAKELAIRSGASKFEIANNLLSIDSVYWDGSAMMKMSEQPSVNHQFDYITRQWTDPRTLVELKTAKWVAIKQSREAALAEPLSTPYGVFDAGPSASASIIKSVLLANTLASLSLPVSIDFTLANNTVIALDAQSMVQVGLALAAREQAIRATATALRTMIDATTTAAALDLITW